MDAPEETPQPKGRKRRKGRMAGGAGWVISKTVPPTMPADARLKVLELSDRLLVVQTPNRVWWPGPCFLLAIVGVGVYFHAEIAERFASDFMQGLGALAALSVLFTGFLALTAFLSTHQWLRVGVDGVEYQLRLGPRVLTQKRAQFGQITGVTLDPDDGSSCLVFTTEHWSTHFGMERSSEAIDYLLYVIRNMQAKAVPPDPAC